jgi:hypothetical protein
LISFLHYPVADLRIFQQGPTGILPKPVWPSPLPYTHFLRSIGQIKRRNRGGVAGWVGEEVICDARKALPGIEPAAPGTDERPDAALDTAKRFFYFDGLVVGKFEVVLLTAPRVLDHHPVNAQRFAEQLLAGTARVRSRRGRIEAHPVTKAGPALARLYLRASTAKSFAQPVSDDWVRPGAPCLILYYSRKERIQIPSRARKLPCRSARRVTVHQWWQQVENVGVRVFAIQRNRGASDTPRDGGHPGTGTCRELRILLGRLHTEYECLRLVLEQVAAGGSTEDGVRADSEFFQHYLNEATRRFKRADTLSQKYFAGQSPVIETFASEMLEEMEPGGADRLLLKLKTLNIRPQILRKTEQVVKETPVCNVYNIYAPTGAVGPGARADGTTLNQQVIHVPGLNVEQLARELAQLRAALGAAPDDPRSRADLEAVTHAELAAKSGDGSAAVRYLKSAGRWVLDAARDLSVEIAVKVLEGKIGLPG